MSALPRTTATPAGPPAGLNPGLQEDLRGGPPAGHATARPPETVMPQIHRALRFLTAGSVDDGKSTLIGRLLYDSRAILADQIDSLQARSAGRALTDGAAPFDLSQLTDGLEAEREQGITIDVAYRYFTTPQRKFIIADAPGHEQYTRNMVTAAAGSDAAVVLVDITKLDWQHQGVALLPQTRRHTLLAHLLRVPHIVFAVNKMDAVDNRAAAFAHVRQALLDFAAQAGIAVAGVVPVSALRGDNVVTRAAAGWVAGYEGPSLLQLLEQLPSGCLAAASAEGPQAASAAWAEASVVASLDTGGHFSLPVQYVARHGKGTGEQPRVLWGRIAHGGLRVGDTVQVFPSGETARVAALHRAGQTVLVARAGQSAGVVLDRQLDVCRGDWLATPGWLQPSRRFTGNLAWLDTEAATPGRKYWLRHGNRWVQARLVAIRHQLDIHSLQPHEVHTLAVNQIGEVEFELQQPLPLVPFAQSRSAGAAIVVDPASHRTSGALLVHEIEPAAAHR